MKKELLTIILFLIMGNLSAQSCFEPFLQEGIRLYNQNEFEKAKPQFEAAGACPDKNEGMLAEWKAKNAEAQQKMQEEYDKYFYAGQSLFENKEYEQAIGKYEQALNFSNKNAFFITTDSIIIKKMKMSQLALEKQKEKKMFADYGNILNTADLLWRSKKHVEAIDAYDNALKLAKNIKLEEIDTISVLKKRNTYRSYIRLVQKGDSLVKSKEYSQALLYYENAYNNQADTLFARQKIRYIDILAKEEIARSFEDIANLSELYLMNQDTLKATIYIKDIYERRPEYSFEYQKHSKAFMDIANQQKPDGLGLSYFLMSGIYIPFVKNVPVNSSYIIDKTNFHWGEGTKPEDYPNREGKGYYDAGSVISLGVGLEKHFFKKWAVYAEGNFGMHKAYTYYSQYIIHPITNDTFFVDGKLPYRLSNITMLLKRRITDRKDLVTVCPYLGFFGRYVSPTIDTYTIRATSDTIQNNLLSNHSINGTITQFPTFLAKGGYGAVIGLSTDLRISRMFKFRLDVRYGYNFGTSNKGGLFPYKDDWNRGSGYQAWSAFPNTPFQTSYLTISGGIVYTIL